jgi:hypothetical protein
MEIEIVKLQIYTGKLLKNENGEWQTQNQSIKIERPSKEWNLFLKNAAIMYSKIELVSVDKQTTKQEKKMVNGKEIGFQTHLYDPITPSDAIINEVNSIFGKKANLTADQQRIADLESKLAQLMAKSESKTPTETKETTSSVLESLRDEYFTLIGKKPHHKMNEESLIEAINEFKTAR